MFEQKRDSNLSLASDQSQKQILKNQVCIKNASKSLNRFNTISLKINKNKELGSKHINSLMGQIQERFVKSSGYKKKNGGESHRNFYYSNSPMHQKKTFDKNSDLLNILDQSEKEDTHKKNKFLLKSASASLSRTPIKQIISTEIKQKLKPTPPSAEMRRNHYNFLEEQLQSKSRQGVRLYDLKEIYSGVSNSQQLGSMKNATGFLRASSSESREA